MHPGNQTPGLKSKSCRNSLKVKGFHNQYHLMYAWKSLRRVPSSKNTAALKTASVAKKDDQSIWHIINFPWHPYHVKFRDTNTASNCHAYRGNLAASVIVLERHSMTTIMQVPLSRRMGRKITGRKVRTWLSQSRASPNFIVICCVLFSWIWASDLFPQSLGMPPQRPGGSNETYESQIGYHVAMRIPDHNSSRTMRLIASYLEIRNSPVHHPVTNHVSPMLLGET